MTILFISLIISAALTGFASVFVIRRYATGEFTDDLIFVLFISLIIGVSWPLTLPGLAIFALTPRAKK